MLLTLPRSAPNPPDARRTEPASASSGDEAVAAWAPSEADTSALCLTLTQQTHLDDSIRHLAGQLRAQSGASQIRLGWFDKGHVALHGSQASDDQRWADAMAEALDQGQTLCWPPHLAHSQEWVTLAQGQLAAHDHAAVLTLILPGPSAPLGALSLAWTRTEQAPLPGQMAAWQALATQAAPILAWQRHAGRPWHWHLRQQWASRWRMRQHPRLAWGLALLLVGLTMLPFPERVGGQGRIEGAQQRVLVATTDGFIKQVHAQPGDRVKANQVLADLAEQDLKLEREKWASQAAQQDNAYAAAMTRADRTEAALAMSRLEEAQAQLALVDEQLQRTQLKAPFDGVLIQGDLTQAIGAPVKQGDTLMTVASTSRWRVMIDIDESDVARVHPGQTGAIALSALPWDTLPLRVVRITPIAKQADGRNVFEVEAEFTAPVPPEVRPGLMGQAKVHVDRTPLIWSWLRPVVNRIRLGAWSWLG